MVETEQTCLNENERDALEVYFEVVNRTGNDSPDAMQFREAYPEFEDAYEKIAEFDSVSRQLVWTRLRRSLIKVTAGLAAALFVAVSLTLANSNYHKRLLAEEFAFQQTIENIGNKELLSPGVHFASFDSNDVEELSPIQSPKVEALPTFIAKREPHDEDFSNPNPAVRLGALIHLKTYGHSDKEGVLARRLKLEDDRDIASKILTCISLELEIGVYVDSLFVFLQSDRAEILKGRAATLLGRCGDLRTAKRLVPFALDETQQNTLRECATESIVSIGVIDDDIRDALAKLKTSRNQAIADTASRGLVDMEEL